ncbi:MAG: filamentous hemagglutinin N-terminal domain-containing protein, partial [Candidatus Omnitrophica bacterium]|nr:filamentous hemagglutinin N-terminal domain-containing protein [Candidatus Omnitrophota bacterium]
MGRKSFLRNKFMSSSITLIFSAFIFLLMTQSAQSLPEGEQVVSGEATFTRPNETTLNINTPSDRLIAEYNSFSIAQQEAVHFYQPSSSSIALNRVVGVDPSSIFGT